MRDPNSAKKASGSPPRPDGPEINRRALFGGVSAMIGAGLAGSALAAPSARAGRNRPQRPSKVETRFVEFPDPIEEFEAHFRMERDLVERQGTTLTWFYWLVYLVPGDRPPVPLLRYEGTEYSYFRKVAPHTYRIHAHNVSLPRSLETNDYIESMTNPLTGERIETPPSLILNDPGVVHSPRGFRNVSSDGSKYVQPYRQFRLENGVMKLDSVRSAPPDWPINHIESSIQQVDYELFRDKTITSLPSTSTGLYVFPYPKWLKMGDRPGHLLGYWDSWKISSPEDFPDMFQAKLQRDYPELLKPRWAEFERPVSFTY